MAIEARAPAKVNLTLHLTGLRADGYHLLDSLVVFAGEGDRLTVAPAPDLQLQVSGPFAAGVPSDGRNLVLRAARMLQDLRGVTAGANVTLEKNLPHGGGIGGGSADAAAALRLLAQLWGVAPARPDEAAALGADVPVCLDAPRPMVMRGIGEILSPAPPLPPGWLVLVNPGVHVDTGAAFRLFDVAGQFSAPGPVTWEAGGFLDWLSAQSNDFTGVIRAGGLAPEVDAVLAALSEAAGCQVARLSGSGSTCWGWFDEGAGAETAAGLISAAHPGWWVKAAPVGGLS